MPRRHFKTDRLLLLAIAVSLAAATGIYYLIQRSKGLAPRLASDKALLSALAATVVILFLGLAYILIRNLVLLVMERRHGVLGSRFRFKLVFVFAFLLFIPAVALFLGAIAVIDRSLDDLSTTPVEEITEGSEWLAEAMVRREKNRAAHFAALLAEEIGEDRLLRSSLSHRLGDLLARRQKEYGVDLLAVYRRDEPPRAETEIPVRWRAQVSPVELIEMPPGVIEEVLDSGRPSARKDELPYGARVTALAPVFAARTPDRVLGVVAAGYYLSPAAARRVARIEAATADYENTVERRPAVKRLYIVVFALLTALVLFAGVWTGQYLARQITDPLSSLVDGTRAISSGDLSHRITAEAGDEIGHLIRSFNAMVAELQRNAREIEERRRYIETLLENAPVGVLSLDPEGRVATLNRAALRILRLEAAEETLGRPVESILTGEHLAPLRQTVLEYLRQGQGTLQREFQFELEGRPVGISAVLGGLRGSEGEALGTLVVLEDLTALLRAQKQAAWREVARRIAHEIKNPLTPIQLSAQRILKRHREGGGEGLGEVVEEAAPTIVREVGTLKQMVDEFSRFARMPALRPSSLDPDAVVEEAVGLYRHDHPEVEIRVDLSREPTRLLADRSALKRALVNILDNALEAMGGRGELEVRTALGEAGSVYRLEVADTGPGISAEDRERLFLPYFSTKRRGTGLGLAIVHRIVTDHGGEIRVEENRPRGTRFVLELPVHREGTAPDAGPAGEEEHA
jgi:two-component system nitrogen regulation sensor histidine kinase NtrY